MCDINFYLLRLFYPKSNRMSVYSTLCPLYLLLQQLCFKIALAQWGAYKSSALQISLVSLSILLLSSSPVVSTSIFWIRKPFLYLSLIQWQQNHNRKRKKRAFVKWSLFHLSQNIYKACLLVIFLTKKAGASLFSFQTAFWWAPTAKCSTLPKYFGRAGATDRAKMCSTLSWRWKWKKTSPLVISVTHYKLQQHFSGRTELRWSNKHLLWCSCNSYLFAL